jgi:hypothetical protein
MTFHAVFLVAWALSGFSGPQPAVGVDTSLRVYAEQTPAAVEVSGRLFGDATSPDLQARADAMHALIHEFAHTRQRVDLEPWQREGGAEAYARTRDPLILRRVGVPPVRWAYLPETARVIRMLGARWILKGQFST